MTTTNNTDEKNLGKMYEIVAKEEETLLLPKQVTKSELVNYIEDMIKRVQPRHLRKEGREKHNVDDYNIPFNYFLIDSNTVNFNSSMGTTITFDTTEELEVDEIGEKGLPVTVPNRFRDDDIGQVVCLHIFKHGRKTLDEIISELTSLDKHMLTILVNKLLEDGYLVKYKEEDGLETLELKEKEDIKKLDEKD